VIQIIDGNLFYEDKRPRPSGTGNTIGIDAYNRIVATRAKVDVAVCDRATSIIASQIKGDRLFNFVANL